MSILPASLDKSILDVFYAVNSLVKEPSEFFINVEAFLVLKQKKTHLLEGQHQRFLFLDSLLRSHLLHLGEHLMSEPL